MSEPVQQPPQPQARKGRQHISLLPEEHERLLEQARQAAQYRDQYLRTLAEFDNTKKRLEKEREEFIRFSSERLLRRLLPILDSFEQALKVIDESRNQEPTVSGVRLIFRQLMGLLEKEGLRRIDAVGKPFDHHLHEALQQVETNGAPENTVLEEVRVGYTLHEKVIRPALVKVAKKPSPQSLPATTSERQAGTVHSPQTETGQETKS